MVLNVYDLCRGYMNEYAKEPDFLSISTLPSDLRAPNSGIHAYTRTVKRTRTPKNNHCSLALPLFKQPSFTFNYNLFQHYQETL